MTTDVCPKCSYPAGGGKFCPRCGTKLSSASGGGSGAPKPVSPVPAAVPTPPAPTSGAGSPPRLAPAPGISPNVGQPPLPPFHGISPISGLPSLPPLPGLPPLPALGSRGAGAVGGAPSVLECSLPERFEEGLVAAVIFRFRRRWRGSVETTVSLLDGDRVVAGPVVRRGPEPEEGAEISLNVRPPEAGSLSVEVRVERRYEGSSEPEVFSASLILLVQPRDSGVQPPLPPIIIQGPNLGDLFGARPSAESAGERLHAVANPRVFRPLPCTLAASPSRLTLNTPDGLLHLVSRSPAWFGRQGEKPEEGRVRDNAIVLHFAPGASPEAARAALCISRTHFLVEKAGPACRVRDGAPARDTDGNILPGGVVAASRGGLAVGGETLPPCGFSLVPAGERRTLRLAPAAREGGVFSLDLFVVPSASRPAEAGGALLRRPDGVPEAYLTLWDSVDLEVFAPELRGRTVRWDGFRFLCGAADAPEAPLVVGRAFGPDAWRCEVAPFSQL